MSSFNFNNKTFYLFENSQNGQVDKSTIFKYKQKDNLVTADYFGGSIKIGKIVAQLKGNQLQMLYQCITKENELKAGKAIADLSIIGHKIHLKLHWEWFTHHGTKGTSYYIEA